MQTLPIDSDVVVETINKGFMDNDLDDKSREVLKLIKRFVEDEQGSAPELAEKIVRERHLPVQARPLVDFSLSFGAETSPQILALNDPALRGVAGHDVESVGARKGVGYLVLRECHLAFCQNDPKYQADVEAISSNSKSIIVAIAAAVAGSVGLLISVVTALTAAALWFIAKIGVNTFCSYYSEFYPTSEESPTPSP